MSTPSKPLTVHISAERGRDDLAGVQMAIANAIEDRNPHLKWAKTDMTNNGEHIVNLHILFRVFDEVE